MKENALNKLVEITNLIFSEYNAFRVLRDISLPPALYFRFFRDFRFILNVPPIFLADEFVIKLTLMNSSIQTQPPS